MPDNKNDDEYVYLMQVYNDVEADIVEGLLAQYDIKTMKQYRGNKNFIKVIMGSVLGVDIFVKLKDFGLAKEIIEDTDLSEFHSDFPDVE